MLRISYFTDVLCIWAYVHDIRMRALSEQYGDQIEIRYHFLPLFAAVHAKIDKGWKERGGWDAYGEHVLEVASRFGHLKVHPDIWRSVKPHSSASPHLFIKALQLLQTRGRLDPQPRPEHEGRSLLEAAIWELRVAFFKELQDISAARVQQQIAEKFALPWDEIDALLRSGEALASLFLDLQLQEEYRIKGSPTLVFNEGRQILYGNVGYRVIEANIAELLSSPPDQASWC